MQTPAPGLYSFWRHVFQVTVSNLGSSIIVYGALFKKNGMVSSSIAVTIIYMISHYTIHLMLINTRHNEPEFQYTLYRVFGRRAFKFYNYQMLLFLVVCSTMFQVLMATLFHSLISQFLESVLGYQSSPQNNFTFKKFSYQWAGVINFALGYIICNIKDFSGLMKIASKAFITNLFVFAFVTYKAIANKDNISQLTASKSSSDSIYSTNYITTFGVFMYSFLLHPYMVAVARKAKNQEQTPKSIGTAMFISFVVYLYFGIIGNLGIVSRNMK